MKFRIKSFWKEESGALNEFIGFIFFLLFVLGLLIPSLVELFSYNNQGQELDRLTKLASQRACSLMANPDMGSGGDIHQGSLGFGTDVSIMPDLVDAIFQNEAANFNSYSDINLEVFDVLGERIDLSIGGVNELKGITYIDKDGTERTKDVIVAGTNMDMSLCPAGGGANTSDWKWCRDANDQDIKDAISDTGFNTTDSTKPDYHPSDLVARMEKLQPGRSNPGGGEPSQQDFRGRIDRCTVCATKARQSIFQRTAFGTILGCNGGGASVLPCTMRTCASAKFVQYSAKRGYSPKYRDKMNLGGGTFTENSPHSNVDPLSTPTAPPTAPTQFFCSMNKNGNQGVFEGGSEYCTNP